MDTPKIVSIKNPKPTDPTTTDASKLPEIITPAAKPADTKPADPPGDTTNPKDAKPSKKDGTRVLSVAFPAKVLRQLKLLSSIEGVSIASIVISSVTKSVKRRLPAALEALKSDLGES